MAVQGLIWARQRFAHAEIERQLNYFEVMLLAAGFFGQVNYMRER